MINGIGTDIIEISRIKSAISKEKFLKKVYTDKEIELIKKQGVSTAAVNFAAKEAVAKAFGTGFRGFGLKDIEILRNNLGCPYVVLHGVAKDLTGGKNINISLSHCKEYAVAFVILS